MTESEKKLLSIDLCGRLPYDVKIRLEYKPRKVIGIVEDNIIVNGIVDGEKTWNEYGIEEFNIKPYLRPMTSMTEDEKEELKISIEEDLTEQGKHIKQGHGLSRDGLYMFPAKRQSDLLNKHMFDYRGLIEKGLALEAVEGMYDFA